MPINLIIIRNACMYDLLLYHFMPQLIHNPHELIKIQLPLDYLYVIELTFFL